jgi:hypothetical protein
MISSWRNVLRHQLGQNLIQRPAHWEKKPESLPE